MTAKVRVRLFHELRANVGASELKLEANSLNELLHALTERYGSLKQLLFDSEGKLRQYTFLYVNNVIQQDLTRKLNDGDLVLLVPTAAGGRGWMRRFDMYVPETLEDLLAYIDRSPSNGTHMIANGSDLMNRIQRRQVNVKTLIDLSGFRELNYVKKENNTLRIGALTTISDLTSSTILDERLNVFGEVAAKFGGPAIRNVATVGGNVCAASSSEDLLPVLLVLDAKVRLKSRTGERVTSLEQFLKGKRQTDLKPNEILVETFFSEPPARSACSFEKIGMRNSLIIALVNSAVYLQLEGYGNDARVQEVRIAFNRVQGKIPGRARVTEDKLRDRKVTEEPVEQCLSSLRSELKTTSDFRVGAEYRQDVACVLFKRAFKSCVTKLEAPN